MELISPHTMEALSKRFEQLYAGRVLSDPSLKHYDAVHYFISHQGKRIRPLLLLAATELFGGDLEKAAAPAFGIEIFHNFTLVHDDIMDEAELRRGRPSVHIKYGLNKAIIGGDMMMAYAYKYLSEVASRHLPKVFSVFNQTAIQIIEGQQMDIDFEERDDVSTEEYLLMIEYKTSVLLAASLAIGAIVAGASNEEQQRIYDFGKNIGLAFQIKDDYLDAFGSGEKFGKKIGGDILQNKNTYLQVIARQQANPGTFARMSQLKDEPDPERKIEEMLAVYEELGIREKTEQQMESYYQKALQNMTEIKVADSRKQTLLDFAKTIYLRDH